MLLPFSIRVAEWPPVCERADHLVNCTCLSWALVGFCVCPSFPFGIEGGMWDVILLIPDHCLSIYLMSVFLRLHRFSKGYTSLNDYFQEWT